MHEILPIRQGFQSMIVSTGLPIRTFLNKAIANITERGQLKKILKKWELQNHNCVLSDKDNPLGIKKLSTLFIVIVSGFVLGLITLMAETLTKNIKDSRNIEDKLHNNFTVADLSTMSKYLTNINILLSRRDLNSNENVRLRHHLEEIQYIISTLSTVHKNIDKN